MQPLEAEFIRVDRTDGLQKTLSGYGGRVATLLGHKKIRASPHMVAALDDSLGALFALLFARQGSFQDRTKRPIEVDAVVRRSKQIAKGEIKASGPWLAGFHFNSAMYRLAAAYHRVLKVVSGKPDSGQKVAALRPEVERQYWWHQRGDLQFEIAPPEWNKPIRSGIYQRVWRRARAALKSSRAIVFIGYSLPAATDLPAQALLRVDADLPKGGARALELLVLVNPDQTARSRIRSVLSRRINDSTRILTFERLRDFARFLGAG